MTSDRRKGEERRGVRRFEISVDIEWEAGEGRHKGVIGDISQMGCLVLCSGVVEDGDEVKLYLPVSDGMRIEFTGEIINHVQEIGFGMKFVGLNSAQEEVIARLIRSSKEGRATA